MKKYKHTIITPDSGATLDIEAAELVAQASSKAASKTNWTELRIYGTPTGNFVFVEAGCTTVEGQQEKIRVADVSKSITAAIEFFGHGWLAKRLYTEAGIDSAIKVS